MRKYMIFLLIIAVIVITGCSQNDYAIAKVGKLHLYKSQFIKIFPPIKSGTVEENKEKAEVVLQNALKQLTAYEYLRETNQLPPEIVSMAKKSNRSVLLEAVYNDLVTSKIHVPEYEVYKKFSRERTTIWAQHIMVDNKKLADSIYTVLKEKPAMFEVMAGKYSIDNTTNQNNGMLKPFSGGKMVPVFEDACFSQPIGIIGKPVESPFGWHIIRVNKREEKDMSDYATASVKIRKDMENEQKKKYEEESIKELRDISLVKMNDANIAAFIEGSQNYKNMDATIQLDSLPPDIRNLVLVTSVFGAWNADSVIKYSLDLDFGNVPFHSVDYVKNSIDRILFFMAIYDRGERMGAQFDTGLQKESILSMAIFTEQNIMKTFNSSVEINDSLLRDYYDTHLDEFMTKGSVGIYLITNPDSAKVAIAADSVGMKKFEELSRIHSILKPKEFAVPSYYVYTDDDTLGYYKKAMELGNINKVSGMFKNNLGFNVIKVVDIKKQEPEDFAKIKNTKVTAAYRKYIVDGFVAENYAKALEVVDTIVYRNKYNQMLDEILSKI